MQRRHIAGFSNLCQERNRTLLGIILILLEQICKFSNFARIKKQFIQNNVVLVSSASVVRAFSFGRQILTKNRMKISVEHFEQLLFLKYNKKI